MGFNPVNNHQTSISALGNIGSASPRQLVQIADVKSAGVAAGTFSSGAWRTRVLNTIDIDELGTITLSSNQVTLQPGTYEFEASAPAFRVDRHRVRLHNITDNTTVQFGQGAFSNNNQISTYNVGDLTVSSVSGKFTITSSKVFELQHRCQTTVSDNGFGQETNFGDPERYAVIRFWKV